MIKNRSERAAEKNIYKKKITAAHEICLVKFHVIICMI